MEADYNWLGCRVKAILSTKADRILSNITNSVGGWESWAQVELFTGFNQMVSEIRTKTNILFQKPPSIEFSREEPYEDMDFKLAGSMVSERSWSYYKNPRITDFKFKISFSKEIGSKFHWVEMKCQSSNETRAAFLSRVKTDIDKAERLKWDRESDSKSEVSVWVLAITINTDAELEKAMGALVVGWNNPINLDSDGIVKIWTYCHRVQGIHQGNSSLLGYSYLRQLEARNS